MFNLILIILSLIVCLIHLYKYGIEDRYDIDFLVIFVIILIMLIYNIINIINIIF